MARSKMEIDRAALEGSHDTLHKSAQTAKAKTQKTLKGAKKLGSTAGHKVFAAWIDGVLDELAQHLPDDIERLVSSYADGLLDLEHAMRVADQELAQEAGRAGVVALFPGSASFGGGPVTIQGSAPDLQGGSVTIQGTGSGSADLASPATPGASQDLEPRRLPLEGRGAFPNSSIVTRAQSYGEGQWGGQCRAFVSNVLSHVSDREVDAQAYTNSAHDYFASLEAAGGVRVAEVSDLQPGDVVQIGQYDGTGTPPHPASPHLHTFIIAGRNADGTFRVVDSNSRNGDELVHTYSRTVQLSSDERAYRFGTV